MIDKIINEKLNQKGLQLLYWDDLSRSAGMWVVATSNNGDTRSIHFDLNGVVERWLYDEKICEVDI